MSPGPSLQRPKTAPVHIYCLAWPRSAAPHDRERRAGLRDPAPVERLIARRTISGDPVGPAHTCACMDRHATRRGHTTMVTRRTGAAGVPWRRRSRPRIDHEPDHTTHPHRPARAAVTRRVRPQLARQRRLGDADPNPEGASPRRMLARPHGDWRAPLRVAAHDRQRDAGALSCVGSVCRRMLMHENTVDGVTLSGVFCAASRRPGAPRPRALSSASSRASTA